MSSFLKIVCRNIIKGPSTIKYPFEDSPAPEKLRGKIKHNPEVCVACGLCAYVCAGGAIKLRETEDGAGVDYVVWHDTCTFCGLCEFYCPTKAIHLTNDYHTAHLQEEKFDYVERTYVKKQPCIACGKPIIPVVPALAEKIYAGHWDVKQLTKMCPECRRRAIWEDGVKK